MATGTAALIKGGEAGQRGFSETALATQTICPSDGQAARRRGALDPQEGDQRTGMAR
jgi:hypothetical protein